MTDSTVIANELQAHCGEHPGLLCRLTFDAFHNGRLAEGVDYFLARPATILIIVVMAIIIRALANRTITRLVRHTAEAEPTLRFGSFETSVLTSERRRQRAETMGSVFRSMATFAIFATAFVMILGELGFNLAPILASAGILGIALGFGAQNLVRDFLSGIFMILEDQFGVGDVIDVKEAVGVVEAVSLRTTRLRDVNGCVWHVRNGEILRVGNHSQGWSRAIVDVPVDYDEDIAQVRSLLKQTAEAMRGEDRWAAAMLDEPEVWGIETLSGEQVVIRVVAKTTAEERMNVMRELRQRIKDAFDAAGIAVARPQRKVWLAHQRNGAGEADSPA
jgi:small conductance mechanosensitive channel